jgi:hypothetical protein
MRDRPIIAEVYRAHGRDRRGGHEAKRQMIPNSNQATCVGNASASERHANLPTDSEEASFLIMQRSSECIALYSHFDDSAAGPLR